MALDFTLLTEEQVRDKKLDVIKKYGIITSATDLSVLLGCAMNSVTKTSDGELACDSWIYSSSPYREARCIGANGFISSTYPTERGTVRPVLPPSETANLQPITQKKTSNDVNIVEYGEYPQTVADEVTSKRLEDLFQSQSLQETGKNYIFDSTTQTDEDFKPESHKEYKLDGKKYIRVKGRPFDEDSQLSNGEIPQKTTYWVEVQPIEWLADPTGTWISKKTLLSGIQFDTRDEYNGDFSKTFMKKYLNTYFSQEIEPYERPKEREKRLKREEAINGLKAKLTEAIDPEKVKATVGFTRTESRREIAEAIKTTRRARDVFIAAAKKAQKEGDQELIDKIVEMADFYVRSDQAQRRAAHQRRAEYRVKRAATKENDGR